MSATDTLLQQGIAAARSGNRATARTLLSQLVEHDERSEQGWLWLAGVTDEPENIRICLENVLELNPASAHARQGLAWIEQRYGPDALSAPPPAPAAGPIRPIGAPAPPAEDIAAPATPAAAPAAIPVVAAAAVAPDARQAAAEKKAEAKRLAAEKKAEERRIAEEKKAEAKRLAAEKKAEAKRLAAEKKAEERRIAEEKKAEAKRLAAEKKAEAKLAHAPYPLYAAVAARGPDISESAAACPYCGEMNELKRTWCSRCEHSLMIRGPVREARSVWVSIIGVLWKIGGVIGIIAAVLALVLALVGYSTVKGAAGPKADVPVPFDTFAYVLLGGMLSFGQLKVAGALMDRQRWAYIIVLVVTGLQFAGALINMLVGAAFVRAAFDNLDPRALPPNGAEAIGAITGLLTAMLLVGVVIQGLFMLMVALGWRDFFGAKVRFLPEVKGASDADLFNNGLACKSRKMWFMAMRQWEAAAGKAGRDPEYLHALGVAYAKLGWVDQARDTLDRAIRIAPKDERLQANRARLDRATQP